MRYSAYHWGIYQIEETDRGPVLKGFERDPEPTKIGLDQLEPQVKRLRIARPSIRRSWLEKGPGSAPHLRGREPFIEVKWEQALDLAAGELARIRDRYGNSSIFGGSYGWSSAGRFHHAQSQVHRFLNCLGGYVRHVDTYSMAAGRVVMPHIVDSVERLHGEHTSWDVMAAHTRLFVTFGGIPAKNSFVSSGGATEHILRDGLYRMKEANVRFVNIGPVSDNMETGGPVEWIQIRPNTDAALMLAMTYILVTEKLADEGFLSKYCVGYEKLCDYLLGRHDGVPKNPVWAEHITGVPAARIENLAREIASTRTMLNVAYSLQRAENGEQPFFALVALAAAAGQIGLPGGGFGIGYGSFNSIGSQQPAIKGPTLPQGENAVRDFIPVARVADMLLKPGEQFTYDGKTYTYQDIKLIYWAGGNPYHHHQDINRLRRAWEKPDTILVHEQYWTPTAKLADIVFPATIPLEREDISFASRERYLVAMSKVSEPFEQSRDDYAIFSALAERLNIVESYTEGRDARAWIEHLYAECSERVRADGIELPGFDQFWSEGLVDLGEYRRSAILLEAFRKDPDDNPLPTPSGKIELFSERIDSFKLEDCPGHPIWLEPKEWLGAEIAEKFPFHLISDQPDRKLHSQLDHASFSTDGKHDGRECVAINKMDAAMLGIADGDAVELFNDRGRCLATAVVSDNVMPSVVRLSTGSWLDPFDKDELDKQGNPNVLTQDVPASGLSGGCAAHSCLVSVKRYKGNPAASRAHELPPFIR